MVSDDLALLQSEALLWDLTQGSAEPPVETNATPARYAKRCARDK
jgi:hypothetical protein